MSVIETKDLTKVYKQGESNIYGANKINLNIEKGELVGIIGNSGSGKTTILNMLGGIDRPTNGKVLIDGIDLYALNNNELAKIRRLKIGYIFQNYNLLPILTAKENIIMPTLLDSNKVDTDYLESLASILGIHDRLNHLPSELSGGQKQRVAIARALINHPDVILADEPTGNLDRKSADEIIELFIKINQMGNTVVLVTHDEKYTQICNKKIVICDGEIMK